MTTDNIFDKLDEFTSDSLNLESLIRPLLEIIENSTGLESVYFTAIDAVNNTQKIVFSRNVGEMTIPEGLTVPWEDTLCKRSLEEEIYYTNDVPAHWSDCEAAQAIGIQTFASEPVRIMNVKVYGTLCGASRSKLEVTQKSIHLLRLFAQIVARQLEREDLVAHLRRMNIHYGMLAMMDPLTGIPNRRALLDELGRMLARAQREGTSVHAGFIDLDDFKFINDTYGHDAGDRFLIQITRRLKNGLRTADLLARYGGDEFVVLAMSDSSNNQEKIDGLRQRLQQLVCGQFDIGSTLLDYAGASIGVIVSESGDINPEELITKADAAMYEDKQRRRKNK